MNKKTLTYVGIGLVVVVGGFFVYKKFFVKDPPTNDLGTPETGTSEGVGMPKPSVDELKSAISESAKALETSDKEMVSEAKRKGLFGERAQQGIDPKLDEAMAIRDEASRIRKGKGVRDARWFAELQGQKLKLSVQAFMLYKNSNASTQEKLDGAKTMLQWAKSR